MIEKRRFKREPYPKTVSFAVSVVEYKDLKSLRLEGIGIDISEVGLSIETEYPLEAGHVLRFQDGINQKAGIVKWSTKANSHYRVGINFV